MAWKKLRSAVGSSRSGATLPTARWTWARADPPSRLRPPPRSMSSSVVSPRSVRSSGVKVPRTSRTGAKAVTIKERGAVTLRSSPFSSHTARSDIESLPTGTAMPRAGQSSIPTALTASWRPASSPGCPAAAIQLQERRICWIPTRSAAAMLVIASPTAIRAEAAGSSRASGVRSPIATASPLWVSKLVAVTATSATGTCQGPTI